MNSLVGKLVSRVEFPGETWVVVLDLGDEIMVVSNELAYNHPWPENDYGPDDPDDMQTAAAVWLPIRYRVSLPDEWEWK